MMVRNKTGWSAAGVALIAFALGLVPLHAPPLLDDLAELPHVAAFASLRDALGLDCYGLWRPVKNLFFAFAANAGLPAAHFVAAAVFACAVLLAWCFFLRLGFSAAWAVLGASLWALSPTMVSSVAWLSSVNILIMVCAALAALRCWDEEGSRAHIAAGHAFFALALVSYEGAIALPALWFVTKVFRTPSAKSSAAHLVSRIAPIAATAVAYLLVRHALSGATRMTNEGFDPALSSPELCLSSSWFFVWHARLWLWPFGGQSVLGDFVHGPGLSWLPQIGASWLALVAIAAAAWSLRHRRPAMTIGLFWFLIAFAPMSNLLPLRSGPFADYFLPLPSLGLAIATLDALRWLAESPAAIRRAAVIGILVWRGAAAALSFSWAAAWRDERVLLERSFASQPGSFRIMTALASARCSDNREEAARLLEESFRIAPWYSQTMFVQGRLALDSKRYADAKVIFARASTACPTDAYPPATLGFIADTIDHDPAAAKKFYSEALTRKWSANSETAVLNYSAILATEGSLQEARRVMEDALPKMGGNASLLHNLAVVCKQAGDTESSQNYFTRYKSLVAAKAE